MKTNISAKANQRERCFKKLRFPKYQKLFNAQSFEDGSNRFNAWSYYEDLSVCSLELCCVPLIFLNMLLFCVSLAAKGCELSCFINFERAGPLRTTQRKHGWAYVFLGQRNITNNI